MNPEARFEVPSHIVATDVNDEAVLLDLSSGTYFSLDGVGRDFWTCLSDGLTLGACSARLAAEYEVEADRVASDLDEFTTDLVSRGLLERAGGNQGE